MSSHQHNIVSRVGWLDFSIVTALSLLFVEVVTLYSSSSSEKSGPDFPRFFFFYKSSDRNGNFRGWGHLLVSLVPDVDQLSESREAFFI